MQHVQPYSHFVPKQTQNKSRKHALKAGIVLLVLLGSCLSSFGQDKPANDAMSASSKVPNRHLLPYERALPQHASNADKADWKLISTVDHVKFYYQQSECMGRPMLLVRIENRNKKAIKGTWKMIVEEGAKKIEFIGGLASLQTGANRNGTCDSIEPDLAFIHPFNGSKVAKIKVQATVTQQ